MKKIWIAILAIALALVILLGALVYLFVVLPRLGKQTEGQREAQQSAEAYLEENWPDYRFVSLEDGTLTLEYPLPGSFDQLQKHGPAAGYDAVAEGHLETGTLILQGCERYCGLKLQELVVIGRSSDDKEVYRASTVEGVTACWDE